jgi:superfamily I DNA/RNA helicase
VQTFDVERDEIDAVGQWIKERTEEGLLPHEFGVFVRSKNQLARAKAAVESADLKYEVLDDQVQGATGHVSISTMHLAKGLEFRAVTVMACDDEVIPSQERIETIFEKYIHATAVGFEISRGRWHASYKTSWSGGSQSSLVRGSQRVPHLSLMTTHSPGLRLPW